MAVREACPACQSQQCKKNGHIHNGKQHHQGKDCGRQLVLQPENCVIDEGLRPVAELGRRCHSMARPFRSRQRRQNARRPATRVSPLSEERYPSKEDYLRRVQHAAEALVQQGYLLAEDLPTVTEQAAQRYDVFRSRGQKA